MSKLLRLSTLALALCAALPAAQAATHAYNFSGAMDSGAHNGSNFTGSLSFDDAGLTGIGDEWLNAASVSFSFLGNTWTLGHAAPGSMAEVAFTDGAFLGLSFSVNAPNLGFSLMPASFGDPAWIAYDVIQNGQVVSGLSGAGTVIYAPVPEPDASSMLLAGLGLICALASRRIKVA